MDKKIGLIGCGNMAQAIIGGIINSKLVTAENIIASDPDYDKLKYMKDDYGRNISFQNTEVASFSDILILAVKPFKYGEVIDEIKDNIKDNCIIVTIAAGITINFVEERFNKNVKVIRTMPNTPALVGEGMAALCRNSQILDEDLNDIIDIFNSFGKCEVIEEKFLDAITAISSSSPAYVYMFIEALADGGVLQGIPRDKAYNFAAQAVLGSAKMVLETGEHPGTLKDKVCSPGGTTIEAVYSLEKNNFRGAIIEAVDVCTKKAAKLSKGE